VDVINVKRVYRACWDIKKLNNKKKSTVYVNFYAAVCAHEKRNTTIQKLLIVVLYGTRRWLKKMWLYMMSHDDVLCYYDGLLQHYYEIIYHLLRVLLSFSDECKKISRG